MLNALIVGASGYTGAELVNYLQRHPDVNITAITVSAQSPDAGKLLSDLYPQLKGSCDLPLQPLTDPIALAKHVDLVFLATAHEVSHDLVPLFVQQGCRVFDISGAFRVNKSDFYQQYYGFEHKHPELLEKAIYGLAEFKRQELQQAQLIAVPGCYPTASQLGLKPLIEADLLSDHQWPVINATSGVSGAGRKAALGTSFCEVSLQPYGLFTHRHQPEIAHHLGIPVIFTPQLGNFSRGILATITCCVKPGVSPEQVNTAFEHAYQDRPLVRWFGTMIPSLKGVVGLPYCDIGFAMKDSHLIVVSAEDNLLKGAAAQAVQCMNLCLNLPETRSLVV